VTSEFEALQDSVAPVTAALRDAIGASEELTARLARELDMNASDAQALYLLRQDGPMGVAELAGRLGMRGASATVLVDRLERAGHAVRERDPHDRRRVSVSVTQAAVDAIVPVWSPHVRAIDAVAGTFSADEQAVIERYLRGVRAAIDPAGGGDG
jgi:DNA-binding MarR family transcriptional regulator